MLPNIPLSHLNGPPDAERRHRSLEIVRRVLREAHYSSRTEEAYVFWIRRFIVHNDRRHPKEMGEAEVGTFLSMLAVEEHVAASTQNQAMAALRFLYERVLRVPLNRVNGIVPAKRPRRQLKSREEEFRRDTRLGVRTSGVSDALMRKYPNANAEWRWQYVMAAARTFVDASGVRRRHHFMRRRRSER